MYTQHQESLEVGLNVVECSSTTDEHFSGHVSYTFKDRAIDIPLVLKTLLSFMWAAQTNTYIHVHDFDSES